MGGENRQSDDKRGSSSQRSWSIDKLVKENIKKHQEKQKLDKEKELVS